ncbi:hypothetical protein CapIbe_008682 [Capra ibex]
MPEGSDVPATGSVRRKLGARAEAGFWSVQGPQALVWVSCKTGHLAGEPVSGRSAGVSPVDVAPRTPRTLGISTALVAAVTGPGGRAGPERRPSLWASASLPRADQPLLSRGFLVG